jgi:hypothetical protein
MAILWVVCGEQHEDGICRAEREASPINLSDGPESVGEEKYEFGEHAHNGKPCPGGKKRPRGSYWGSSSGEFYRWEKEPPER